MMAILVVSSLKLTSWSEIVGLALKAATLDLGLDAVVNLAKAQFRA
jgi:hypothetical protein